MATLGQALTSAEAGWKRLDNKDTAITYTGTWGTASPTGNYGGDIRTCNTIGSVCKFKFTQDKIRLIASLSSTYSSLGKIRVDGVESTVSFKTTTSANQVLVFELTGLNPSIEHTFELYNGDGAIITIDAVDIADNGVLKQMYPTFLTEQKTIPNIKNTGDYILCDFNTASANVLGFPLNLGNSQKSPIPVGGTPTPDGSFGFIYVGDDHLGRKMLLADRGIQNSLSAKHLQYEGLSSPSGIKINRYFDYDAVIPVMTSTTQDGITVSTDGTTVGSGTLLNIFDNNHATYYTQTVTPPADTGKHYIKITFDTPTQINAIMKSSAYQVSTGYYGIRWWRLSGSIDDINWTTVVEGYHQNNIGREFDEFDNKDIYKHYRFEMDGWYATAPNSISLTDFQLYKKKAVQPFKNYNIYMRLPKKSEYEKYIIKNTFGGSTVAGDMNIWNHSASIISWCYDGYASYRYTYSTTANTASLATIAAAYVLRPMLIIEPIVGVTSEFRVLVQNGDNDSTSPMVKYNIGNNTWDTIGRTLSNIQDADFDTNGMTIAQWDAIPSTAFNSLASRFSVRAYSPAGESRHVKSYVVPEDRKVLMTTDHAIIEPLNFDNFNIASVLTGNADIRFIVSTNSGGTWHTFNGTQWNIITTDTADIKTNGMTIAQFNSIGNKIFDILTANKTIRVGFVISVQSSTDAVEIDTISYQYDKTGRYREMYKGTEYDVLHDLVADNVEIFIYTQGDVKIDIMT